MSLNADQFLQVKCKFQLISESESSQSIHSNNEKVRLCCCKDLDKNSTLVVMICSNDLGNNHILAYYIERRVHSSAVDDKKSDVIGDNDGNEDEPSVNPTQVTFSQLASISNSGSQTVNNFANTTQRSKTKPRLIIKQIYYHSYNEDIVAICLSETGKKLVLVCATSTIYILPIRNILLNLHAQQLRSSQGKSMYFYDASIVDCCSIESPVAVVCADDLERETEPMVVIAGREGELSFINLENKKELSRTSAGEPVQDLRLIKDRFTHSLLINCANFKQYRLPLELLDQDHDKNLDNQFSLGGQFFAEDLVHLTDDSIPPLSRRPIPIKLTSTTGISTSTKGTTSTLQRVLIPNRAGLQTGSFHVRERPTHLVFYQSPDLISVVDVLGSQKSSSTTMPSSVSVDGNPIESRLLRFFWSRQFYYRPQKPTLVCKISDLDPDEMISNVVLTDRFLAITTDMDRCLVYSRNCCNLKNASTINLDPLVKEIVFNSEEKILTILKSPISNDSDNIIDSFLLVTTRSIYSIESRRNCRDMFVNFIDSQLGIKPIQKSVSEGFIKRRHPHEFSFADDYIASRKNSEILNHVSSFLCQRDEVYERIQSESAAFSMIFKLDLSSLYEAYADKLLIRNRYELANRFFKMAKMSHMRILGKYLQMGAYRLAVDYVRGILSNEEEFLEEKDRLDLFKAGFDCLLAKTIVERSKFTLFKLKLPQKKLKKLIHYYESEHETPTNDATQRCKNPKRLIEPDPFSLCEHAPQGQSEKKPSNTIIVDGEEDDEDTLTSNQTRSQPECERALINFMDNHLPEALIPYVMTQLVEFDLIDVAASLAQSESRIQLFIRALLKAKDKNRAVLRDSGQDELIDKLTARGLRNLVIISVNNELLMKLLEKTLNTLSIPCREFATLLLCNE